jgi:O-methyltransferase involved in polyketide biosynthesis
MSQNSQETRNFNSISPSARTLLLLKGYTNIPYARRTAELLSSPGVYEPDYSIRDATFWARTLHFENRYLSIDQLLEDLPAKNILELSSGFSFRGLEMTRNNDVHYIDTDLQEVIQIKREFTNALSEGDKDAKGQLEIRPLNCLDEDKFSEVTARFGKGNLTIVNEGLLMYLNMQEKKRLCRIIHKILRERGGYWITADIYIKKKVENMDFRIDDKSREFFHQHNIEENKFSSFNEAEEFFRKLGFVIDREAEVKSSELSSFRYFMKSISLEKLVSIRESGKMQKTWRLKIAE